MDLSETQRWVTIASERASRTRLRRPAQRNLHKATAFDSLSDRKGHSRPIHRQILDAIERGVPFIWVDDGPRRPRNVRLRPVLNMQDDIGLCQHVGVPVSSSWRACDKYSVFDQMRPDLDSPRLPRPSTSGRDIDGTRLP